jgi:hypothetical protein
MGQNGFSFFYFFFWLLGLIINIICEIKKMKVSVLALLVLVGYVIQVMGKRRELRAVGKEVTQKELGNFGPGFGDLGGKVHACERGDCPEDFCMVSGNCQFASWPRLVHV